MRSSSTVNPYVIFGFGSGRSGRGVRKGQTGIRIVSPVIVDEGNAKITSIKPAYVCDVTQTQERTQRAA